MVNPQATTLPDGSLYVVWDALPVAEEGLASPLDLTSLPLQGARYYPTNQTWGVIHTFSAQGFAESYAVDATNTSGEVLELVSQQPLLNDSTAERLVEYDILTGDVIHNVSATGISEIVSFRGRPGARHRPGALNGNGLTDQSVDRERSGDLLHTPGGLEPHVGARSSRTRRQSSSSSTRA